MSRHPPCAGPVPCDPWPTRTIVERASGASGAAVATFDPSRTLPLPALADLGPGRPGGRLRDAEPVDRGRPPARSHRAPLRRVRPVLGLRWPRGGQPLRLPGHRPARALPLPGAGGAGQRPRRPRRGDGVRAGRGGLGQRWRAPGPGVRRSPSCSPGGGWPPVRSGGRRTGIPVTRSTSGPTSDRCLGAGPTSERGGTLTPSIRENSC